ncbi:MAG: prolyl aminopeptidase [Clostridiales bacterium]|jgi:proline iminopeptidase|nr:prolyl aminopeptidase [Clostridiales bacterium]
MFDKFAEFLFPEIEPFNSGFLEVSDIHKIYFEEVGNPQGRPVVYLHGGPGNGVSPEMRRFFDPKFYRVILFDQRGCGKSTPLAELRENTTWDLVADIEKIREHLGIEKWLVYGGSWGSTLSLFYSETHPLRVVGMILRGIFLARRQELDGFWGKNAVSGKIFPEEYQRFIDHIPEAERDDMIKAYYDRLLSPDENIRNNAAIRYFTWECTCCTLLPQKIAFDTDFDIKRDIEVIVEALLELHYFVNNLFCERDNYILENIGNIKDIPTIIVQGRYDICCLPASAYELNKALPKSKLVMVPGASHVIWEPGIQEELIKAQEEFKNLF